MTTPPTNSLSGWLRQQAATARSMSQTQLDCVANAFGLPTYPNVMAWTPETLAKNYEARAVSAEGRGE